MPDDTRLTALESRLAQAEEALVTIGVLLANELDQDSSAPLTRVREKAEALATAHAEDGRPETARLIRAFLGGVKTPWSFFDWLDRRFYGPPKD